MPKNIVVCCDGTGNTFSDHNTNVTKLFSVLDLDSPARQVAYYHAGLGTMGAPNALSRLSRFWTKLLGLAFGYGLAGDIGDAYAFLMDTFEPGDRVFLFGFSRGAFTVRALAGMLHMFGLVRPGDYNLVPYAVQMLKRRQDHRTFQVAEAFNRTFCRQCKPHFIGVFDTVGSVGWIWDPVHIPFTARNPDLAIGRHAVSIDERRCYFRQNLWGAPLPGQDIKQVWFAGVHSDIGGGYPERESGLAKITLEWMLREAYAAGLLLHPAKVLDILGRGPSHLTAPDAAALLHNSLSEGPWWLLEPLPHLYTDMKSVPPRTRIRFPFGRRRTIRPGSTVHSSVLRRKDLDSQYRPPNLPTDIQVEPWIPWPDLASTTTASGESSG